MITITSVEFQRHFGRYQDEALKEPVSITRNGRERIRRVAASVKTKKSGISAGVPVSARRKFGIRAYHSALGFHALVGMILDDFRLSVRASSGP